MDIRALFSSLVGIVPRTLNFLYDFEIIPGVNLLGVSVAFAVIGMLIMKLAPNNGGR